MFFSFNISCLVATFTKVIVVVTNYKQTSIKAPVIINIVFTGALAATFRESAVTIKSINLAELYFKRRIIVWAIVAVNSAFISAFFRFAFTNLNPFGRKVFSLQGCYCC